MSLHSTQSVTCPHCGKTGNFMMWQSLNVQLGPEAKEALKDGSLFYYDCEGCGQRLNLVYDILYHDMERKVLVQLAATEEAVQEASAGWGKMIAGPMAGDRDSYRMRTVRSTAEMREKVYMFDHDLDDRAVEMMKVIIYTRIKEDSPEYSIEHIFLKLTEDGPTEFEVLLQDGKVGIVPFDRSLYDMLCGEIANRDDGKQYIVDTGWALDFLKANAQE